MNKLPERLYFKKDGNVYAEPFENSTEYIRKDVAEEMAKKFAKTYAQRLTSWFLGSDVRPELEDLFTEFLNSKAHDF